MPRPLRIEFPNACYHVICRGNARLPIFEDDADKELLLDRMVHFAERNMGHAIYLLYYAIGTVQLGPA